MIILLYELRTLRPTGFAVSFALNYRQVCSIVTDEAVAKLIPNGKMIMLRIELVAAG